MHKILYKLSYLWYNPVVEVRDTGKSKTERARELRKGIDEYFDERTARGRFPTEAGMLLALGLKHEEAHGSLRVTFDEENTMEEVDYIVDCLEETISLLRSMSPLYEDFIRNGGKEHV